MLLVHGVCRNIADIAGLKGGPIIATDQGQCPIQDKKPCVETVSVGRTVFVGLDLTLPEFIAIACQPSLKF
jgi:hypothetical protein